MDEAHLDAAAADFLRRSPSPVVVRPRAGGAGSGRALAIVETRPSPWLVRSVSRAVQAHPGWPLYVFAPASVHAFLAGDGAVDGRAPVSGYHRVTLDCDSMTTAEYSRLLLSPEFWRVIREEHVLVFQTDCAVVRPVPDWALRFDYIGALCGRLSPRTFVMNGGLSLRRRSAMLRVTRRLPADLEHEPEDVAVCAGMRRLTGFALPSMAQCDAFAVESQGNPDTAVGAHGVDKGYAPGWLLRRLLPKA